MLMCSDGTLYTGVTTDVERRLLEHNTLRKKAAKYTWARRPVKLVFWDGPYDKSKAYRLEALTKRMSRKAKLEMIEQLKN